jgi:hypothetical protein
MCSARQEIFAKGLYAGIPHLREEPLYAAMLAGVVYRGKRPRLALKDGMQVDAEYGIVAQGAPKKKSRASVEGRGRGAGRPSGKVGRGRGELGLHDGPPPLDTDAVAVMPAPDPPSPADSPDLV